MRSVHQSIERSNKADRTSGTVSAVQERFLQLQQVFLLPRFESQRIDGVALITPAFQIMPVKILVREQQETSFSGQHGPRIVVVVLVVRVLVAVVGVEVPRVVWIGRVLRTRPRTAHGPPTFGCQPDSAVATAPVGNPSRVSRPVSSCPETRAGRAHNDATRHASAAHCGGIQAPLPTTSWRILRRIATCFRLAPARRRRCRILIHTFDPPLVLSANPDHPLDRMLVRLKTLERLDFLGQSQNH